MEATKKIFFDIVKNALHGEEVSEKIKDAGEKQAAEEAAVYQALIKHNLSAITYEPLLEIERIQHFPQLQQAMKAETMNSAVSFHRIFSFFRDLVKRLEEANISFYILKGFGLCSLYPTEEMRRMNDIDIYVPDEKEFARVQQMFAEWNYSCAEKECEHHIEYYCEHHADIIKCELHRTLVDDIGSKKARTYIEQTIRKELERSRQTEEVLGVKFPVLPPTINLWYLILHMLHHFLGFGCGINLLCDIALFMEQQEERIDWEKLRTYFEGSKITGFAEAVLYLAENLLCKKATRISVTETREQAAYELLEDFWEYDSRTSTEERSPINLERFRLKAYLKMCNRQIKYHFPKLSAVIICRPVLGVILIYRVWKRARTGKTANMSVLLETNTKRRKLARKILK